MVIEKEFLHKEKPGSKVYLGNNNVLLLEFQEDLTSIYQVKHDQTTSFIADISKFNNMWCPKYFSPDFTRQLKFETS